MKKDTYEFDFERLTNFLSEKFPGQEFIEEGLYDQAYKEYELLYPMDLVLYENRFEFIFYNRPIGHFEHYWKLPKYALVWEHGKFFKTLREFMNLKINSTVKA